MESPEFAAGMRSQSVNGGGSIKRKRSTFDSSPASLMDHDRDHDHDMDHDDRADASPDTKSRRLPGVKRACNECRQQKVRKSHVESPTLSTFALHLRNPTDTASEYAPTSSPFAGSVPA
jgi:hypothetical protein